MGFARLFPLLIAKMQKKGRTRAEVYEVTTWLASSVCGVKLADVEAPPMLELRCLDELAKGWPMEKILRK